jgi:hypothetical protein
VENQPKTRLVGKEFSPMIIRRYSTPILHFVAMITDDNLDELDSEVTNFFGSFDEYPATIQGMRNFAGGLTDYLSRTYKKSEGIAVILQADKMTVSSLYGDFMNHEQCRLELYSLLNFSTQV